MGTYISSNANRCYVATEPAFGRAASITNANRFPVLRLQVQQSLQAGRRLDKTGTRSFLGISNSSRRYTSFEALAYLTSWAGSGEPAYGPFFQGACGAPARASLNITINGLQGVLQFTSVLEHGLAVGSGVAFGNEIRFVTNVIDSTTFQINAPFRSAPQPGNSLAATVTYALAANLPSVTIYDYWDPITAVSRVITGAAVDTLRLTVNGDFHEFSFAGPAADLLDSSSFVPGSAGLAAYPVEPRVGKGDYSIVPGHLGEVWLGSPASQFFTLVGASLMLKNNIDLRDREFGSSYPLGISPGAREVITRFSLLAQDDAQTIALYAAAKQRSPIASMLQLGQQRGQIMGVFMPRVVPEIPAFNDDKLRLQWDFNNNLAEGVADDEIYFAFA